MKSAAAESPHTASRHWWSAWLLAWLMRGQGRPVASSIVMLCAIFQVGYGDTAWQRVRYAVFDSYQKLFPRQVTRFPVVIVDIDDASLATYGRWPWPRTRLARVIEATQRLGALAIGLDMIMPEADTLSPAVLLAERPDVSPLLHEALAQLPANDVILADTLSRAPVVVARAGMREQPAGQNMPGGQTPMLIQGEASLAMVQTYMGQAVNVPELEAAASGRGYLNAEPAADGVIRQMPLIMTINSQVVPSMALELLRVAVGARHYRLHGSPRGVHGMQIGDTRIPTDLDGRRWIHFAPAVSQRRVSALQLLQGSVQAEDVARKVAIIGVTAAGTFDKVVTPIAPRMDGVEVQAQFIETILQGVYIQRPAWLRWLEPGILLGVAAVLILWLPRLSPGCSVAVFLASTAVLGAAGVLGFVLLAWLVDLSLPMLTNALVLVVLLAAGYTAAERQRQELDAALAAERLARSRIEGELEAARKIQMGMLPRPGRIAGVPGHLEFSARLEPAEEVGGDLYNAFMLDERHFFFLIGDVTGKGIPAALFMALSMTLCKSVALRQQKPLDALTDAVNAEISRDNPAMLFVTAVTGILDVHTGTLDFCIAGHDAPILLRPGEAPGLLESPGGPPLCTLDDFPYPAERVQLQAGDMLVLVTDGVTEAHDLQGHLYGRERVLAYLTALAPAYPGAADVCEGLYADVKRFAAGTLPFDDITIVTLRFMTPA